MINFDKVKQFKQIYEGWKNMLIPPSEMKATIEQVSKDRLEICNDCPKHSKNHKTNRPDDHCVECGCMLAAKVACLSCMCPLRYWVPVVHSPEEEEKLKKQTM
jgi:hypothetical protein